MMQCAIEIRDGVLTISTSIHEKLESWGSGLPKSDNVVLPSNSSPEKNWCRAKISI